jgi:cell division protein FtsZ
MGAAIMPQVKPDLQTFARIKVVGVGGSGCHALARMVNMRIEGVEFIAINTDSQDLHNSGAPQKIHIGKNLTRGLGAGMNPDLGRQAAEENRDEIQEALRGADMVFVAGGFGGGTCTGAASIVAEAARQSGALTVAVITRPFSFEGLQRMRIAEEGMQALKEHVDTLITIQNDRLLQIIDRKTSLLNAFAIVDDVLRQGVQGISDLIVQPGVVNVDFADIRAIMKDAGPALMGIGYANGEDRAMEAARNAIRSPLLDIAIDGARGVLFSVSGGEDLAMAEIHDAAKVITDSINPEAKVIFGAVIDERLKKGELKVTVIATGFNDDEIARAQEDSRERQDDEHAFVRSTKEVKGVKNVTKSEPAQMPSEQPKKQESNGEKQEEEEDWDIPAFIRKKLK